jgi:AraC family ethanolamine operon transcriptional activator
MISAFKQGLGMTPMAYVKGLRLYHVHRELWRAKISDTRVSDVANAWGFWHMGQFAADYRKLFGELPSDTLTRWN